MASKKVWRSQPDGDFVAVIGDEDTVTGFLLAGVGNIDSKRHSNFLIVNNKTKHVDIENAFKRFTRTEGIGIILINQHIADEIRYLVDSYESVVPTILEIPSKTEPYDATKDTVMIKVKRMTGMREA